jgi:hypothetical protein
MFINNNAAPSYTNASTHKKEQKNNIEQTNTNKSMITFITSQDY